MSGRISCRVKLSACEARLYRVKKGQTLQDVARAFGVPPAVLSARNGGVKELSAGQALCIPPAAGNAYRVRGGESKTLLCGSPERFRLLNGTDCFYVGQTVYLG